MNSIKTVALALTVLAMLGSNTMRAEEVDLRGASQNHQTDFRGWVGMATQPADHTARYVSSGGASSYDCNNIVAGGERIIRYPFTVPDSRELQFVRVWGEKGANTSDIELSVRRSCMAQSDVTPVTTTLGSASETGAPGHFTSLVEVGDVPNNLDCRYWLQVEFGTSATACATSPSNLRITKVRSHSVMSDRIFRGTFHINAP